MKPLIALSIVGFIGLMVVSAILGGWALSVTWGWFMVPTFDLPELAIAPAIGVALVVGYLTKNIPQQGGSSADQFGMAIAEAFFRPLLIVGLGWVILQFA